MTTAELKSCNRGRMWPPKPKIFTASPSAESLLTPALEPSVHTGLLTGSEHTSTNRSFQTTVSLPLLLKHIWPNLSSWGHTQEKKKLRITFSFFLFFFHIKQNNFWKTMNILQPLAFFYSKKKSTMRKWHYFVATQLLLSGHIWEITM